MIAWRLIFVLCSLFDGGKDLNESSEEKPTEVPVTSSGLQTSQKNRINHHHNIVSPTVARSYINKMPNTPYAP